MSARRTALVLLLLLGAGSGTEAATLRATVTPHGASVKLSDLFNGLEPGQDCDIGPAPAPGQRQTVPPAQLQAIATQFGVSLPDGAVFHAVSIDRPGRTVRRDEIVSVLKPALVVAGMPPDSDVSLGVFASPTLPADDSIAPTIAGLDYDPQSGRFSASVQFTAPDEDPQTIRVTGRADEMVRALALSHALPVGSPIGPADLVPSRLRKSAVRGAPVSDLAGLAGMVTRQPLAAGTPLMQDQLLRPMMVSRGRPVVLRLASGGLALTAAGTALEAGGTGDRIHVMNSVTRAILLGTVVGASDVEIDPGTAPVFSSQPGASGTQLPRMVADAAATGLPQFPNPAQEAR